MIQDAYDEQYHESMWEAEFLGDRTSADKWTNGRIGDLIGLKSQGGSNYSEWACNYSYGYYNGSYSLWQLYSEEDRVKDDTYKEGDENEGGYNIAGELVIDKRRLWNLPGYNYRGFGNTDTGKGQEITYKQGGANVTRVLLQEKSMYKTPWVYQNKFALRTLEGLDQTVENAYNPEVDDFVYDPNIMCAIRNAGKWRRETIYEKADVGQEPLHDDQRPDPALFGRAADVRRGGERMSGHPGTLPGESEGGIHESPRARRHRNRPDTAGRSAGVPRAAPQRAGP